MSVQSDQRLIRYALRNRALSLVVATTGVVALSATATGYKRAAGSFITDGFLPGMELVPAGFTQLAPAVVADVTASDMTIAGGRAIQGVAGGRSLMVGLPTVRTWENDETVDGSLPTGAGAIPGRPYLEEELAVSTKVLRTTRANGLVETRGLYVLRWYGLDNTGPDAMDVETDALVALFAPGDAFALATGVLRIRTDVAPIPSQLQRTDSGWCVKTVTIPWHFETTA